MKKVIAAGFVVALLAGCAGPKYTVEAISADNQTENVTIVKHNATRSVFLDNMLTWCMDEGKQCNVVNEGTPHDVAALTLTYISRWSWDFRTFVADAKIKAYKNSEKVGEVTFKAPNNGNLSKYGDDDKRIQMMMSLLFGEASLSEAQQKIESDQM
ncbi:Sbal_3080 family lipoprotein [Enterovibrio sp. 27052020O]|uniref:Sbal_3080 family lipoprotein n=1 Tax=Enterovibrio sp. 27052020O TaxID=3241166 RepID=UPI00388E2F25